MLRASLKLFVSIYRLFSPLFHYLSSVFGYPGMCRFPETCSAYATRQLNENKSIISAIYMIIRRLLSCSPWSSIRENFFDKTERKGVS